MFPVTPTSWIIPNSRRIVSPGDNESNQGINNNSNNRYNQFSSLEDSDSDNDESISSTASGGSATVFAIETDAAFPLDQGATDHIIGATERFAQAFGDFLAQDLRPGLHLDIAGNYLNAPLINTVQFDQFLTGRFNVNQSEDSDSDTDTASTVSTASLSSCGSMGQDNMLPSIDEYLRKEYQTAAKSNFNFADAVVFREELGNALAACQHTTRDAGHAYMVDTAKRHCERYGNASAILPPPAQKVELPTGNSSGEWRRYDVLKKIYERENHWNAEAIQATVRRFPAAMKEQKNDYGTLPLNYTVRQALNFIESKVSDRVKKQKAYIDLMSNITARAYVPAAEGPVKYLKEMEHEKHCIDILSESSNVEFEYSWETLIINCQTKIRSSKKHNNTYLRLIEDKWETDVLDKTKTIKNRWDRFKALYIEELQKLTDDGIDNAAMHPQQDRLSSHE